MPRSQASVRAQQGPAAAYDEFIDHDALALAELIRDGTVTPQELLDIVVRRIETSNATLSFMTTRTFSRARKKAVSISVDTPFAGVPFLMKDMIDVGGVLRTDGSRFLANNVPKKNVPYVDAIEEAGLNIVGMTNVPEFASLVLTSNDLFGATRNPWNLDYSTFTSSGGAAAAVSAGAVPMAHGTDGAGSCRLPASATGILGMKASRLRMLSGEADGGHDVAKTNQVLSRTVRDSAALLNCTEDKSGRFFPPIGYVNGPSKRRLKIGLITDSEGLVDIEKDVHLALEDVARLLQDLGHEVGATSYPSNSEDFCNGYFAFSAGRLGGLKTLVEKVSGTSVAASGLLTHWTASFLESLSTDSDADIGPQKAYLDTLPGRFADCFTRFDLLLTPVSPVVCPKLDEASPGDEFTMERFRDMMGKLKFTGPVNFGGNPAMSVPLGWASLSAVPIGAHFIAANGDDRTLYQLAYELEESRPWRSRWAPHSLQHIDVEQDIRI